MARELQLQRKLDIFKINVSHERYLSIDLHLLIAIVVLGERWNNLENFKICDICLNFFHKNMSHEQLLFTWSIFRDSSMGKKLKKL